MGIFHDCFNLNELQICVLASTNIRLPICKQASFLPVRRNLWTAILKAILHVTHFIQFYPLKRFSRVLMQQGRVQLDADWNEQTDILLHDPRSLTRDIIGPYGGPGGGFKYNP